MTASSHKFDDAFERAVLGDDAQLDLDENTLSLDHDAKFDLALLDALDPVAPAERVKSPPAQDDFALDAEFDAAMIGSGAVAVRPLPQEHPVDLLEMIAPQKIAPKTRDYNFDFGFVWGNAGFVTTITIRPQCRFRVEKMMATDTHTQPGFGTSIIQVAIGQKIQRPGNAARGSLSTFFAQTALADGISLDTAHPWEAIALTISFIQDCTFHGALFGTAEVE